jgi:non-heme chloroperoxidase
MGISVNRSITDGILQIYPLIKVGHMKRINHILRYVFVGLLAMIFFVGCSTLMQQGTISEDRLELKSIRVNDTTLHYVERGQGTPVVFVHGAVGDYRTWDGQIEAFSEKYRVISYSRRYHYPNEYPQDAVVFPRPDHVNDLKEFLDALDIRPIHLVGHSGGGAISLLFARDYPEYLISLTLGEPAVTELLATTPEGVSARQSFDDTVVSPSTAAFQVGDDEEGVRLFINGVMGKENAFDNLPENFREGMLQNAHTMRSSMLDKTPRTRPRPSFSCEDGSQIRIPTFLILGELSPKRYASINDTLEPCLPNVERAMLRDASHGLEMENPDDFNEMVLLFLSKH